MKYPVRIMNPKRDLLSRQKIIDIFKMANQRDRLIILLMSKYGMRCREIARFNIEDIGYLEIYTPRKIIFPDSLEMVMLDNYLGGRRKQKGPVFLSESKFNKGQRLSSDAVSRIIKRNLRKINIDTPRITSQSILPIQ